MFLILSPDTWHWWPCCDIGEFFLPASLKKTPSNIALTRSRLCLDPLIYTLSAFLSVSSSVIDTVSLYNTLISSSVLTASSIAFNRSCSTYSRYIFKMSLSSKLSITDLKLEGERVLIRVDFNVP